MAASASNGSVWIPELIKFLNLGAIIFIIWITGRKGISAALKSRTEDIQKKIVDAKTELERMQHEAAKARTEIAEISKTKDRILNEMREEGLKTYEIMIAEASATADRILTDAKLAADNEVSSAIAKVKKEIVDQAVAQALKTVREGGSSQGSLHEKLVGNFIQQLQEKEGLSNGL